MEEYLKTRNGHNMYDISSMLQKAIRRADIENASYAGMELFGKFNTYLWKRLYMISAEDCYGIITKEIVGLKNADDFYNKGRKGYDRDTIFVAKAITLLCMARKNRDACYVACNFMDPDINLEPEQIEEYNPNNVRYLKGELPDYIFDWHTLKGRKMGKTDLDMTISEENALTPHQYSFFDNANWENYYNKQREKGKIDDKQWSEYQKFAEGKESNPSKSIIIKEEEDK